jgi:flagellar biosynthesis chaperone FliJ
MTKRRFTSKLQSVRVVREHAELIAMRDLAGELRQAAELKQELTVAHDRLHTARTAADNGGVTAGELLVRQAYVERVERELTYARMRANAQDDHVEATRLRLQEAARDRETVVKLEGRRRAAHDQETRRLERTAGEELAVQMHMRQASA